MTFVGEAIDLFYSSFGLCKKYNVKGIEAQNPAWLQAAKMS